MSIPTRITVSDMAAAALPAGRLSKLAFETDEIELRFYAPRQVDRQVPHDRDELYFVVTGSGTFEREAQQVPCQPGDVLFAAAGERHRFVDFSDDFMVWVVFYGNRR